ncbi:aspartate aminotransferase family protein [Micromonospora sp. C32]|uniref:pyridoxal phosphate-dependent decarboxylase family protein n=1 Tax=unclassified Micromonospora TaxID=2617518 RepID=UPI001B377518|nr:MULTISPECIES: pyridoxal-dependent decarboxylase [unclassified Micromonospora]MBQ1046073.1 aspartate aminotransferase family protein [Micromonospora sp. C72]MBQ1057772.1 aspartate aminotransferase family protein [Micromonospora sp. C32]
MDELRHLFRRAADHAADYRRSLPDRPVGVPLDQAALTKAFAGPLPDAPTPSEQVLADLAAAAEPGLVASAGPRYFGFVVGGASPAATAADMLAVGWDQIAFNAVTSPAAVAAETAAGTWLKELLGIPATASVGFVTGAQAANTAGLAAARHQVLADAGWDVEQRGLLGAPAVRVFAGAERHATIDRSLRLLGLGTDALHAVPTGPQGAVDMDALAAALRDAGPGPTVLCLQAGNVNTGACDDLRRACDLVHRYGGWAHVDGAFGLWAAASPATRHLVDGLENADSWACDGHKWLNLPYDSAFAFCARPDAHAAAMSLAATYLVGSGGVAAGADLTAESSRRARGFAVWAGLRELGRDGVAALVERCCALARRFADGLAAAGFEVVNDVVLNQVLVGFGDDARTDQVVAAVQADGTCWVGGTTWRGRRLMRISVSNATTTEADVDRSVAAIIRLAHRSCGDMVH